MIKSLCVCVETDVSEDIVLNEIYEVELYDNGLTKSWIITIEDKSEKSYLFDYDYTLTFPFKCFIPIADFRQQRIDSILKDD